uniref:ATP synthase F0 subunit b n=1 Tax=Betaphycus gelatinus TaxID=1191690 RepID=A0A2H4QI47_9FLOR|nr:ATP synthase F0 subunit b [Betaphycus gelatinus]ATX68839.1 ATP synthase F0 subunit b [Betaphycus gelatinus]
MVNFSFIIILSFILVYQNVIILNEETLILICFITFCYLAYNRLHKSIQDNLQEQSVFLKSSIKVSLNLLLQELTSNIKTQDKLRSLAIDFKNLGDHFLRLNFLLLGTLPLRFIKNHEKVYPKKLFFANHLEQQTTKLLALILSHKLTKIPTLQKFYTKSFKISFFLCIDKISMREYLETI